MKLGKLILGNLLTNSEDLNLDKMITNKKVYNRKRTRWHKNKIIYLNELASFHEIPQNLLVGIYLIETSFRPWYFRIGENILVIFCSILNLLFKKPFKNYTIGRCQIGIASILKYHGRSTYKHTKYITAITVEDLLNIIKSMYYKNNLEICSNMIVPLYKKSFYTANNYNGQLCHVGEEYNGRYSYGLLLEDIVNLLDNSYFDI